MRYKANGDWYGTRKEAERFSDKITESDRITVDRYTIIDPLGKVDPVKIMRKFIPDFKEEGIEGTEFRLAEFFSEQALVIDPYSGRWVEYDMFEKYMEPGIKKWVEENCPTKRFQTFFERYSKRYVEQYGEYDWGYMVESCEASAFREFYI